MAHANSSRYTVVLLGPAFLLLLAALSVTRGLAQGAEDRRPGSGGRWSFPKSDRKAGYGPWCRRRCGRIHPQAPESLEQLNAAPEGLAAKVSQGVVQILVTGYRPIEESRRLDTALIARQKAIGSGLVVDPTGYVVTNAHVVEGAQRIRVVLPVPEGEGGVLEPEGKPRILEAKLAGVHQGDRSFTTEGDGHGFAHFAARRSPEGASGVTWFWRLGAPKDCRTR